MPKAPKKANLSSGQHLKEIDRREEGAKLDLSESGLIRGYRPKELISQEGSCKG